MNQEEKGRPRDQIDWNTWFQRGLHVAMIFGSAYVAANPEYAWVVPAFQALGQGIPQPR